MNPNLVCPPWTGPRRPPLPVPGRRRWAILAGVRLLALGCGDDGLGRRYPVRGRVTYRDLPVPAGTISFRPTDPGGRVAAGTIVDGSYSLTTLSPGDGAFPGEYRVTVLSKDVGRPGGVAVAEGQVDQDRVADATTAAKDRVPDKYSNPQTSGLTREVGPKTNRIDLNLVD